MNFSLLLAGISFVRSFVRPYSQRSRLSLVTVEDEYYETAASVISLFLVDGAQKPHASPSPDDLSARLNATHPCT